MKLKIDENGNVVVQDGKVVYVHDDGKEIPFDGAQAFNKIKDLNTEAKTWREKFESANKIAEAADGIDIDAARKALEQVASWNEKQFVEAGEVDKIKEGVSKALNEKLEETRKTMQQQIDQANKLLLEKDDALARELIGGRLGRSKFIIDKLAIPPDLVEARFGGNFKIENGRPVAYDNLGNKIYSRLNAGEMADVEEALEILVDNYPHKQSIMKGSPSTGSGSVAGPGNMQHLDWHKLSPQERLNEARKAGVKT